MRVFTLIPLTLLPSTSAFTPSFIHTSASRRYVNTISPSCSHTSPCMTKTPHDDDNTTPSIVSAPQALTSIFSASVVLLSTLTVLPLPSYSAPVTTVAQRIAASQAAPATTAGQKIATTQAVQPKSAVEVATKTLEDSKTIFANAKNNAEKASFESKQRNADVKLDKAAVDKDKIEFMKANDDLAKDRAQRDNDSAIATYTKKYDDAKVKLSKAETKLTTATAAATKADKAVVTTTETLTAAEKKVTSAEKTLQDTKEKAAKDAKIAKEKADAAAKQAKKKADLEAKNKAADLKEKSKKLKASETKLKDLEKKEKNLEKSIAESQRVEDLEKKEIASTLKEVQSIKEAMKGGK